MGEVTSAGLRGEGDRLCAALDCGDRLTLWSTKDLFAGDVGADGTLNEFVCAPAKIDLEPSSCAKTFDGAFVPCGWKRGQEIDWSFVALQEKFGDGGGCAEVSVDLEDGVFAGGVGVE